jgi:MYXO-CTERM domain-containing protein
VWVASQDSDEIVIVERGKSTPDRIPLGWGSAPYGIAFAVDGTSAWVTLSGAGAVAELDVATRSPKRTISLANAADGSLAPRGISVSANRLYVTRFRSPADRGELWRIDPDAGTVESIVLASDPGPDETTSGRGVPNAMSSFAVSPDGVRGFVPAKKDNTLRGLARDGVKLNTDNTVRTMVASVNLETGEEDATWRVDLDNHDSASAVAVSPLGDLVFVASQGTNHVDVLDAYSGKLVAGFPTSAAPQGLVLADGKLFVQCFMARTVDVFDVSKLLSGADTLATLLTKVSTVVVEPLAPEVLRGKQIFYNADDPRMSLDGYLSCATCHPDAGDDGRVWDFTDRGEGLRNTIPLVGRSGTGHGPVHWTANFDEIQDFENDIRLHFGGGGFMRDEDYDLDDTSDPLGTSKAGKSESLDALAAYVSSLHRVPRSPHRSPDGSLTSEGSAGRDLFASLNCVSCHTGPALTDSAKRVLHDVGTLTSASGQRIGEPLRGLDTPTLRGLWASAPYLHDGSAPTLFDVIDNPKHGNASGLSDSDKQKLVTYLLSIENEDVDTGGPGVSPGGGCACRVERAEDDGSGVWLALLGLILVARRRQASGH